MGPWSAKSFGNDCFGNPTGYRVERSGWKYTGNPHRSDGLNYVVEQAGQFVGNIYREGSMQKARKDAESLAEALNSIPMAA